MIEIMHTFSSIAFPSLILTTNSEVSMILIQSVLLGFQLFRTNNPALHVFSQILYRCLLKLRDNYLLFSFLILRSLRKSETSYFLDHQTTNLFLCSQDIISFLGFELVAISLVRP